MSAITLVRWGESSDTHYQRWDNITPIGGCEKEKQTKKIAKQKKANYKNIQCRYTVHC